MLILLPPSEGKAAPRKGTALRMSRLSFPALNPTRTTVANALVKLCAGPAAKARTVLGISARQDDELDRDRSLLTAPTAPAGEIYTGVLYDALDLPTLPKRSRTRASSDIALASALFGLLRIADPLPIVDHPAHSEALDEAGRAAGTPIRALIELNLGMNRCGVEPGQPALELAQRMSAAPGITLAGLMGWEGHLLTIAEATEKADKIRAALAGLVETRDLLQSRGLPCPIVSAGGTGSFPISGSSGQLTEVQAGGAVLMDLFYRNKCHIEPLEFALTLMATVTSRPTATRAVLDMGRKSLNPELHLPAVKGRDDLRFQWLSAEHGILEVLAPPGPAIGERLELIPGYGDWSTLLHDRYHVFSGEQFVETWPLDVRTKTN